MVTIAILSAYNKYKTSEQRCGRLRRVIGIAVFGVAVGMILALILPNTFVEVLCIILCILAGYNLFCC